MFILEAFIKKQVEESLQVECFPNVLPQGQATPAVIYNTVSSSTNKNISKLRWRQHSLQLTVVDDKYSTAKRKAQQIYDFFEFFRYSDAEVSVIASSSNQVDLFQEINQIAITVDIEYIIHPL
ncbi:hypothetical protein R6I31_000044 [Vibrio cholerae]|uniref:hypothetical protein n=1 Tax=Vibrio cholerae TaxID=666 RepID=UPI001E29EC6D|nr:hypothetical protein [Vibrio cholerae]EJL6830118.1 hypothetical protein [Vibrio cholerae]EJL7007701.1 hypothetical protein [Vibrio cholerae]EKF9698724.1 hypothetical protein [Vibrio cholerae]ELS9243378.1 hypothetical protein [Vibrio cholerae]MCD1217623.1 DUF3168 domain-containing protein [Vibrio cholerae]